MRTRLYLACVSAASLAAAVFGAVGSTWFDGH